MVMDSVKTILDHFLGERSVARFKVDMFLYSLSQLDIQNERKQCIAAVTNDDCATTILRLEDALPQGNVSLEDVQSAISSKSVPDLVNILPQHAEMVLDALGSLCNNNNKDNLYWFVYCGGIPRIAHVMKHNLKASVQHKATALLLALPVPEDQAITQLVQEAKVLELVQRATVLNLFKIVYNQVNDENGNYERSLAQRQIPVVCQAGCSRWMFLKTLMASLLQDTSITHDTLGAILLRHY